jgi:peptidoglycan/xylan/chitin deacetylase (PgdA/CDA1 family)
MLSVGRATRALTAQAVRLRGLARPRWLIVLAYHRVLPRPPADFALDRAVVDADPVEFDRQMEQLSTLASPIDLERLIGFLRGERDLPPNAVLVTFDDGYRDNREVALPILQRHRIPAAFFVSTGHITRRRTYWWDRIAYLLHHTTADEARLRYPTELILRPRAEPERARRTMLRLVKGMSGLDLDRLLTELSRAVGVRWDEALDRHIADQTVMTWDDVRELHRAGMAIGSHTRTHRILYTLERDELDDELAGSRRDIEQAIGVPPMAIAYPAGRSLKALPMVTAAVRRAGYAAAFSTQPSPVPVDRPADQTALDPFDLGRFAVDADITRDRIGLLLAAPELRAGW